MAIVLQPTRVILAEGEVELSATEVQVGEVVIRAAWLKTPIDGEMGHLSTVSQSFDLRKDRFLTSLLL
jgi:hypothetical protein